MSWRPCECFTLGKAPLGTVVWCPIPARGAMMTEPSGHDSQSRRFQSFAEFYPYYLQEHSDPVCRRLHFAGSALIILLVAVSIWVQNFWLLLLIPVVGYGFAWVGHFFFEHNRPATFTYPVYSLMGDWVMFKDMLTGKVRF